VSAAQFALFSFEEAPRPRDCSRGFARYPQTPWAEGLLPDDAGAPC
jgi:hypothetical protein